jgi:hypothetical protein
MADSNAALSEVFRNIGVLPAFARRTFGDFAMTDDLKDRGPQDRSRINLNEDWEIRYWTKELGVTKERLEDAIAKVGNSTDAVREQVAKRS